MLDRTWFVAFRKVLAKLTEEKQPTSANRFDGKKIVVEMKNEWVSEGHKSNEVKLITTFFELVVMFENFSLAVRKRLVFFYSIDDFSDHL